MWDITRSSPVQIRSLTGVAHAEYTSGAFTPDGKRFIAVGNRGQAKGFVASYDASTGAVIHYIVSARVPAGNGPVQITIAPNGSRSIVGGAVGRISLISLPDLRILHTVRGAEAANVVSLVFSPDG